jgi:hypothetical protein
MEEMFDSALVADEPEPLVDQEACNCAGWHSPKPSVPNPSGISRGTQPVTGACDGTRARRDAEPAKSFQP